MRNEGTPWAENKNKDISGEVKHYLLGDLLSDRDEENYFPAFVGSVPEGKVPTENLREMLDRDKIMLKPVAPPNQM